MSDDRMSFEEACREIGVTEAELESLVAAGEIASVKEGDTLYFKKDVVRKFKKQRQDEATLLLSDDELNLLDDDEPLAELDLLAEDDEGTDAIKGPGKAVPAREAMEEVASISADDLLESDDLPEIRLDDDEMDLETAEVVSPAKASRPSGRVEEPEGDETLLSLDGLLEDDDSEATTPVPGGGDATLMDTDLLDLGGDADPFTADTAEETSMGDDLTEVGTLLRGGGGRVMQMKRKKPHTVFTILLALSSLILLPSLGVFLNLLFTGAGDTHKGVPAQAAYGWILDSNILQGAVDGIADFFRP